MLVFTYMHCHLWAKYLTGTTQMYSDHFLWNKKEQICKYLQRCLLQGAQNDWYQWL